MRCILRGTATILDNLYSRPSFIMSVKAQFIADELPTLCWKYSVFGTNLILSRNYNSYKGEIFECLTKFD